MRGDQKPTRSGPFMRPAWFWWCGRCGQEGEGFAIIPTKEEVVADWKGHQKECTGERE